MPTLLIQMEKYSGIEDLLHCSMCLQLDNPILAIPCKDSLWKRCLADWLEESGGSARLRGT